MREPEPWPTPSATDAELQCVGIETTSPSFRGSVARGNKKVSLDPPELAALVLAVSHGFVAGSSGTI